MSAWDLQEEIPRAFPILYSHHGPSSKPCHYFDEPLLPNPPINFWDTQNSNGSSANPVVSVSADPLHLQIVPLNQQLDSGRSDTRRIGNTAFLHRLYFRGRILLNGVDAPNNTIPVRVSCLLETIHVNKFPVVPPFDQYFYNEIYRNQVGHDVPDSIDVLSMWNQNTRDHFLPLFDFLIQLDPYNPSDCFEYAIDLNGFRSQYQTPKPRLPYPPFEPLPDRDIMPMTGSIILVYHSNEATGNRVLFQWTARLLYYSK